MWFGPERSQVSSAGSEPANRLDSKHVRVQRSRLLWQQNSVPDGDETSAETKHSVLVFTAGTSGICSGGMG